MPPGPALDSAGDGEAPLRNREEFRELAVRRPGMPDGPYAVDVPQEPADTEGVAERTALQSDRGLLHPMQHLCRQDALAAVRAAITEMEPGPAQQICY